MLFALFIKIYSILLILIYRLISGRVAITKAAAPNKAIPPTALQNLKLSPEKFFRVAQFFRFFLLNNLVFSFPFVPARENQSPLILKRRNTPDTRKRKKDFFCVFCVSPARFQYQFNKPGLH
jgi:hypothetical protein